MTIAPAPCPRMTWKLHARPHAALIDGGDPLEVGERLVGGVEGGHLDAGVVEGHIELTVSGDRAVDQRDDGARSCPPSPYSAVDPVPNVNAPGGTFLKSALSASRGATRRYLASVPRCRVNRRWPDGDQAIEICYFPADLVEVRPHSRGDAAVQVRPVA
ncbi:MAG TPA: hypothetical protein VFT56_08825 [Sphingomonas sp.]|nr:hypothetical protein [Sphingomonas sp.]